jgi:hypothetical protein
MQGHQTYQTNSIESCSLIILHAIAGTESAQAVECKRYPVVPVSPGHAIHPHAYPSDCRRRR